MARSTRLGNVDIEPRTIVFVLYPGLTPLDVVGPLQVLSAMAAMRPGYRVVVAAASEEPLETDTAVRLVPSHTFAQVPEPFALLVPGGMTPTVRAMVEPGLLAYLRHAASSAEVVGSVCTGSLVLGAAGLLGGKRATSHWAFLDLLARLGATPVADRWVEDGRLLTAAGVSAGIDMALYLVGKLEGEEAARQAQFAVEYDPRPPSGGLDPDRAPRALWATLRDHALREGLAEHRELYGRLTA